LPNNRREPIKTLGYAKEYFRILKYKFSRKEETQPKGYYDHLFLFLITGNGGKDARKILRVV
jgi:hypothetical protein